MRCGALPGRVSFVCRETESTDERSVHSVTNRLQFVVDERDEGRR
jgi:hypothetical protein